MNPFKPLKKVIVYVGSKVKEFFVKTDADEWALLMFRKLWDEYDDRVIAIVKSAWERNRHAPMHLWDQEAHAEMKSLIKGVPDSVLVMLRANAYLIIRKSLDLI